VDTFLAIARNAGIIVVAIAVFSGVFVAAAAWLASNTHEPQPDA